jgi:hypothetical protein
MAAAGNQPERISLQSDLAMIRRKAQFPIMFTIEHEFDASVITLVDEGSTPLREDVTVQAFASQITFEQWDPRTDKISKITLSPEQLRDLTAALNLPEGIYRSAPD